MAVLKNVCFTDKTNLSGAATSRHVEPTNCRTGSLR